MSQHDRERLRAAALELGFDQVGFAPASEPPNAAAYLAWLKKGWHGEMSYMAREDSVRRRLDPQQVADEVVPHPPLHVRPREAVTVARDQDQVEVLVRLDEGICQLQRPGEGVDVPVHATVDEEQLALQTVGLLDV